MVSKNRSLFALSFVLLFVLLGFLLLFSPKNLSAAEITGLDEPLPVDSSYIISYLSPNGIGGGFAIPACEYSDPPPYSDPGYSDPPPYSDPGYSDPPPYSDPGYSDPPPYSDPGYSDPPPPPPPPEPPQPPPPLSCEPYCAQPPPPTCEELGTCPPDDPGGGGGASFDYSLSNSGTSYVTKTSGNAFTQNTITKSLLGGGTESVTLSLSGVPSGTSYSISNSLCSPTCQSTITFTVAPTTANGTYPIRVTGSPLNRQTTFNLVVSGSPITVSCAGSPITPLIGQTVTWIATVSGGTGPYTYSWSGTNIPTSPAPNTNPFNISYSTIGQRVAAVTVTDSNSVQATCPNGVVQVNFSPLLKEF